MYNYNYYDYGYDNSLGSVLGGFVIFLAIISIIALAVSIITLIAQWKLYKKAGKGGWEAIVPFYCNYVLVEIAGLKWYWFLFFFAPFAFELVGLDFVGWLAYLFAMFNIFYNISKRCNKGVGFAICSVLFQPICMMILGFSSKVKYDASIPVSENGVFGKPNDNTKNNAQQTYQQPTMEQQQPVAPVEPTPVVEPQPINPMSEVQTVEPTPVVEPQPVAPVAPVAPVEQPNVNQSVTPAFCTNCGNVLMPNAKFCTNCGKQI